jgi:hypothetical protein
MHITRLASNEIFSPSNKIHVHREIGWAKDLSAPLYLRGYTAESPLLLKNKTKVVYRADKLIQLCSATMPGTKTEGMA